MPAVAAWIRRGRRYDSLVPTLDFPEVEVRQLPARLRSGRERCRDALEPWVRLVLRVALRIRYRRPLREARLHDTFSVAVSGAAAERVSEILARASAQQ